MVLFLSTSAAFTSPSLLTSAISMSDSPSWGSPHDVVDEVYNCRIALI